MRQVGFAIATLVFAASFVGCPLLKKKQGPQDDDNATVGDAATVTVGGTGAKNEGTVLRYANETPIANEPGVIAKDGTIARNFPGNGPPVATLAKGTAVAKIAAYFSTGTLIMFDDPSGDGSKLIGWVSPKAFDVAAPVPTKTVVVPPRIVDAGAVVVKDAGVVVQDAGAVVKDAGAAVVKDAGGSALPQPKPGTLAVPPVGGQCPDGWTIVEGMCRHRCTADSECPRGIKCLNKGSARVCTSG